MFENKVLQRTLLCKRGEQYKIKQGAPQFCFLIYVIYIWEGIVMMKNTDLKILTDLHAFRCRWIWKNDSWNDVYVSVHQCAWNVPLLYQNSWVGDSLHVQYLSVHHCKLVHSEYGNSRYEKWGNSTVTVMNTVFIVLWKNSMYFFLN